MQKKNPTIFNSNIDLVMICVNKTLHHSVFLFEISSKHQILTKTNIVRILLIIMGIHTKFGRIVSIHSQYIEQKPNHDGMTERITE